MPAFSTLTKQEQANARAALRVLRVRHGGLALLASRMEIGYASLEKVFYGRAIGLRMAFALAQIAGVTFDDVITGRFPGSTACRHCGHPIDDASASESTDAH